MLKLVAHFACGAYPLDTNLGFVALLSQAAVSETDCRHCRRPVFLESLDGSRRGGVMTWACRQFAAAHRPQLTALRPLRHGDLVFLPEPLAEVGFADRRAAAELMIDPAWPAT